MLLTLFSQVALAKRVALVVGNSNYSERPRRNPVNDANLMQAALKELGFEVSLLRNADRRTLLAGLREFESKARDAEVALFFFAGHGMQVGGNNYLIPVGGTIQNETDVPDESVEAGSVLRRLEDARSKVALVILDACRDNPFAGASRSANRGLGRMSAPTGTIVAYSTAPGSTAADGTGSNGVYTEQLVRQLKASNLDIKEVFDRTAQEVERITGGKQRPREEVGLRGKFVLNANGGNAVQTASIKPELTARTAQPGQAGGLSLDDLQKEEETRQAWVKWQAQMKADFDRTAAFNGSADLQAKAWERFLAAWAQDNPLSREDDELRAIARKRKDTAQAQMTVNSNTQANQDAPQNQNVNSQSTGWERVNSNGYINIDVLRESIRRDGVLIRYTYRETRSSITSHPIPAVAHCGTRQRSDVSGDGSFQLSEVYSGTLQSLQLDLACKLSQSSP